MKRIILLSFLALSFVSCKNNDNKEQNDVEVEKKPIPLLHTGCYLYNQDNNTINLEITSVDDGVEGTLTYALDGKDNNTGTLVGTLDGDELFGEYTFMSEGVGNKREVAFLIEDNKLIEGYGELDENGTAFVNKSNISYTSTFPLTKTDCDKLEAICLYANGNVYSNLQQACIEIASLNVKLNSLKDGMMAKGKPAFVLFNEDHSKAEVFLPNTNKGLLMDKTNTGKWQNENYILVAWKGYVLQQNGQAVYGGSEY